MIHYQLVCTRDHSFDGWFRDSAGFERQAKGGLLECPTCGCTSVRRALMAPSIGRRRTVADPVGREEPAQAAVVPAGAPAAAPTAPTMAAGDGPLTLPDQMRGLLQRLRAEVERTCEPVGTRFAEEARAIHNGEAEARGIFGQSTPEEIEALTDDGIEVARIPWVPRADG